MKTVYKATDPSAQVLGAIVLGFIECSQRDEIWAVMEKRNLTTVEPSAWYRLQDWLDVLSEIAGNSGAMFNFVSIGVRIGETAPVPPGEESLSFEETLFRLNDNYQHTHRGNAGKISVELITEKHLKCTYTTPYPDDLDYGVVYGLGRRFLPPKTHFTVRYDDSITRKDNGGDYTVIHVTW